MQGWLRFKTKTLTDRPVLRMVTRLSLERIVCRVYFQADIIGNTAINGLPPLRYSSGRSCVARRRNDPDGPRKLVTHFFVIQRV